MRIRVNFPFYAATGNERSAVVYFEIDPGHYLGTHTDSAEEIVLILAGSVEASLGEERGRLSAGQAALIPAAIALFRAKWDPHEAAAPAVDAGVPEEGG